jgi:hypothetical protein
MAGPVHGLTYVPYWKRGGKTIKEQESAARYCRERRTIMRRTESMEAGVRGSRGFIGRLNGTFTL